MRTLIIAAALAVCSISFGQSLASYSTFSGSVGHYNISLAGGVGAAYGPDIVYSNTNDVGYYFPGHDMGDELQLTRAGVVNGFTFGYYDPVGGRALHRIDVWFHDMNSNTYITGYTISGLPGDGAWIISVDLSGGFEFSAPDLIMMSLGS